MEPLEFYGVRIIGRARLFKGADLNFERLFWYSAETGAVLEDGTTKAFGAALLSSIAEIECFSGYERIPFDPATMAETVYRYNAPQHFVFEAQSLTELVDGLRDYLRFMSHRADL